MPDGSTKRCSAQQKADDLLREHFNIEIDEDKHHHTVFYIEGVIVENHYDFLNIHAHLSNRIIEERLQQLTAKLMEQITIEDGDNKAIAYLPSPDFHALFMLRHSASHFAAERIVIRHLLDWRYFVEKYAEQTNMHKFLDCLNAVCIDKLGLPQQYVLEFKHNPQLEERVWNEILQPEFGEPQPKNAGYIKSGCYIFRRW